MFYFFEHHTGDSNDNSISDVAIEAASQDAAFALIDEWETADGYEQDNSDTDVVYYSQYEDTEDEDDPIMYHSDWYLTGEYQIVEECERVNHEQYYHGDLIVHTEKV